MTTNSVMCQLDVSHIVGDSVYGFRDEQTRFQLDVSHIVGDSVSEQAIDYRHTDNSI